MENNFLQWGVEGLDDRRNNASLAELKYLSYLSTLYLHITDPMILPKNLSVILILTNEMNLMMKQKLCMQIEFPNLEDLKLSSIEVEKIWQDQPGELSYWFLRLTSLIVEGCGNLKYLFTTSMVESLAQLKRLELCDCEHMEEIIIKNGLGEAENVRGMMLPKLESLKLKGLSNLTRFCTGHLIQCYFLQELWIQNCPGLKTFISNSLSTDAVANNQFEETNSTLFDEKFAFSNIEKLRILGMDNLNMIWHTDFHSDSFCKLKVLKVQQGQIVEYFPTQYDEKIS
ncbi:hypothetical protein OIU85_005247 [Salix viminalis]|uniref:Disease resistance protein At4g27190-like leucine-rich repeats domain-containing protein n=1 Tax=Salix viminalis TaxID=40686 RepID=A0A9Q0SYM6_SALVM|nr:hypothetical protein OIU85_005247 [Salix viminalis]